MPRSKKISRAHTAQKIQHKTNFSLVSLSVYPRSRRCAERIRQGEVRWSRHPKTALERSFLTEDSSSENRIFRRRREKTPHRILPKRMIIYIFMSCIFMCIYIWVADLYRQRGHTPGNTRDRSITHSLQRRVSTKSSISQLECILFFTMYQYIYFTRPYMDEVIDCFFPSWETTINI